MLKSMSVRVLLLILLLQFYAPLVHAHPDGSALAGFAHLHIEIPAPHDHDAVPSQPDSITTQHLQAQTIDIGHAIEQRTLLFIALAATFGFLLVYLLWGTCARWPAYRTHLRAFFLRHSPPSRAPPLT